MTDRKRLLITAVVVCHLLLTCSLVTSQVQPAAPAAPAAKSGAPQRGEPVTIRARQQEKLGDLYRLRGDVEIDFRTYTLRADEVTYNDQTSEITATGHVVFDGGPHDEHLTATRGSYNIESGNGRFYDVVGTTGAKLRGKNVVLTSSNPFSFTGGLVEKIGDDKFVVHHGRVTSCAMPNPKWTFRADKVVVVPGEDAKIYHSAFYLGPFPMFYFPFVEHPVERLPRKTGFLLPSIGQSSIKGTIFGDGFFWAINRSMDANLGAEYYSKRGWAQDVTFRARPSESSYVNARYFGVVDRGVATVVVRPGLAPGTALILPEHQDQGGEELRLNGWGMLRGNVRAVADVDYLSSFLFRAAFADTYTEAINSEVRSTAFLAKDFRGYSLTAMTSRYQNFQSVNRGDLITVVHAPSFELSSVDRRVANSPLFWGFDVAAEGLSRREPNFLTADVVGRFDVYPRVSLPVVWRGWTLRPEVAVRDTFYTERLLPGGDPGTLGRPGATTINRKAFDASVELRPPSIGRLFEREFLGHTYKHVVEPRLVYHYTAGVENFAHILRFDSRDVLSNSNDVEYAIVNRLYAKRVRQSACAPPLPAPVPMAGVIPGVATRPEEETSEPAQPRRQAMTTKAAPVPGCEQPVGREVITWEVAQKYFADPNFGGALVPGRRNVFTTTVEFAGIAFLTEPRMWSPVTSRLRVRGPGADVEWYLDYDPKESRISSSLTYVSYRVWKDILIGGGHAFLQTPGEVLVSTPTPAPSQFNQFRTLLAYGHPNKLGVNAAATIGYDANLSFLQYSAVQTSYNWDCCGLTFEYRRLALGPVRNENQFRFALTLTNIGTFGTLRRQERLF